MIRFDEIFLRHPGTYDVVHDTERPGKKDGKIENVRVATHHKLSAGEVVGLIKEGIAQDPSATFYILAATRGDVGHLGWVDRDNINYLFEEIEGDERLELLDERETPALVRKRKKPLREVDAPVDGGLPAGAISDGGPVRDLPAKDRTALDAQPEPPASDGGDRRKEPRRRREPTKKPGDRFPAVRGKALQLGNSEDWPKSDPAQAVRAFFEAVGTATASEVVQALAQKLKDLGVEHPASLVSRLKQAGFLKEVA